MVSREQIEANPCQRCGGAGGFTGWPGYTCFRCGGEGVDPKNDQERCEETQKRVVRSTTKRENNKRYPWIAVLSTPQLADRIWFLDICNDAERYDLMVAYQKNDHVLTEQEAEVLKGA